MSGCLTSCGSTKAAMCSDNPQGSAANATKADQLWDINRAANKAKHEFRDQDH